jgi:hypothetical protein
MSTAPRCKGILKNFIYNIGRRIFRFEVKKPPMYICPNNATHMYKYVCIQNLDWWGGGIHRSMALLTNSFNVWEFENSFYIAVTARGEFYKAAVKICNLYAIHVERKAEQSKAKSIEFIYTCKQVVLHL